jgi:hypothetical protein
VRLWRAAGDDDVVAADQANGTWPRAESLELLDGALTEPDPPPPIPFTEADWELNFYRWKWTGGPLWAPPATWQDVLKSRPVYVHRSKTIDFTWESGSPGGSVPTDFFAATATTSVDLPAGKYTLLTNSDDGVRVFLDGRRVIENWSGHPPTRDAAQVELVAGKHEIRIEYFEISGTATLQFGIVPTETMESGRAAGFPQQLDRFARIYRPIAATQAVWEVAYHRWQPVPGLPDSPPLSWDDLFKTQPVLKERARSLDFNWVAESPGDGVPADYFAAVATTTVELAEGNYTLLARADDGVRVFFDGQVVIEDRTAHAHLRTVGYVEAKAGKHEIRVE